MGERRALRALAKQRHLHFVEVGTAVAQLFGRVDNRLFAVKRGTATWRTHHRLDNAQQPVIVAQRIERFHHLQALLRIFIAAPQHQQLQCFAAIAFNRLRVDVLVDRHAVDRDTVPRNKLVGGHNHRAAVGHGLLLDNLAIAELLVDENGRGVRRQNFCRVDLKIGQVLVGYRHRRACGSKHQAHRFALIHGQHRKTAGRSGDIFQGVHRHSSVLSYQCVFFSPADARTCSRMAVQSSRPRPAARAWL